MIDLMNDNYVCDRRACHKFAGLMTSGQSVAIPCYRKDFNFSLLELLTSKTNVRTIAHFARLNTYKEEKEKEKRLANNMYLRGSEDIFRSLVNGQADFGEHKDPVVASYKRGQK